MNNTYSYFYIGTKLPETNGNNIKAIPLTFLQTSIAQEGKAVCIEIENDPVVTSVVMVEFSRSDRPSYVLTILNCSRPLTTQKKDKVPDEVWQYKSKYSQYISARYPTTVPRALYVPSTETEQEISQFFRNSNTLKFEKCNTYETGDVTLNITELGFAMRYAVQHKMDRSARYNRLLILQALMLTYEYRMEEMNRKMMEVLDLSNPFKAIFELRNKIAHFNAKSYFHHPVSHRFHELYSFHKLMVNKMNIRQINEELVTNSKALEDISKIQNEKSEQRFHMIAVVLGLLIAAVSIPNVINLFAS